MPRNVTLRSFEPVSREGLVKLKTTAVESLMNATLALLNVNNYKRCVYNCICIHVNVDIVMAWFRGLSWGLARSFCFSLNIDNKVYFTASAYDLGQV